MHTKTDIINQIETGLGSEGSHELAVKFYNYCRENGMIEVDDDGVHLAQGIDYNEILEQL